jgi:hypothetical protein
MPRGKWDRYDAGLMDDSASQPNDQLTTEVIERWLNDLPAEQLQQEIDGLELQIQQLAFQVNARRDILQLRERFRNFYAHRIPDATTTTVREDTAPPQPAPGTGSEQLLTTKPRTLAAGVLSLMDESVAHEWTTGDIYGTMVAYGWIEDSEPSQRSLGAALSRMAAANDIVRIRRGVYAPARLALREEPG